jgi:hypothetical protein
MRLAKTLRGADALIGAGRRHADVRQDHIGSRCLDGRQQAVEVLAHRDYLEVTLGLEQPCDTLSNQ